MNSSLKICFIVFFLSTFLVTLSAQNDFRVSLSFDPKMKALGPYDYSEDGEWNLLLKAAYKSKFMEYSFFLEGFDAISSGAMGVNVNYVFSLKDKQNRFDRWEFGIGPGFGVIYREELDVEENFFELNGEIRYFFNKHLGAMLLGNLKYRSDLVKEYDEEDPWRLSSFLGLIYRW